MMCKLFLKLYTSSCTIDGDWDNLYTSGELNGLTELSE